MLVQPGDGVRPLLKAIRGARRCIQIVIFRFDYQDIERALADAVSRGVAVHALIAHTNRAGEASLRERPDHGAAHGQLPGLLRRDQERRLMARAHVHETAVGVDAT